MSNDPRCKHCGKALEWFQLEPRQGRPGPWIPLEADNVAEEDYGTVTIDEDGWAVRHSSPAVARAWRGRAAEAPEIERTYVEHRCQDPERWDDHFIAGDDDVRVIGRDD